MHRSDVEIEVPIEQMMINNLVIVHPNNHMTIDGDIIKDHSHINESLITSESLPVAKNVGNKMTDGAINAKNAATPICETNSQPRLRPRNGSG